MAIKQSQYKITLANGEDIYHFETDDNMVKIVDGNKNVLGTFKEYGMEGKVVTSGAFTDLKVTGIYKVTNLTGLPSGYAIGKMSILSVKAVGKVGNPDLISYDLFSQTGDIYHNVVLGNTPTGWTSGGTTVKNALSTLTNGLGDLTKLNTAAKGSLVNAVNEVSLKLNTTASTLTSLASDLSTFKGHSHDDRYVVKSGDLVTGNLGLTNNAGLISKITTGDFVNLVKLDDGNTIQLGDSSRPLIINSRGSVMLNGYKVFHEGNDGSGSGLDADKLDGLDSDGYAVLNRNNTFNYDQIINAGLFVEGDIRLLNNGQMSGYLRSFSDGEIKIVNKNSTSVALNRDGKIVTEQDIVISSGGSGAWPGLRFSRNGRNKGIGLELDRDNGNLALHDWDTGKTGFYFNGATGSVDFSKPISISGRKLFLQNDTPTGSISYGDIWFA